MFQVNFKEVKGSLSASMMFHDSFKVSSSIFHVFSRLFEQSLWVFHECFKHFLKKLQEYFGVP